MDAQTDLWDKLAEAEALLPNLRQLGERQGEAQILAYLGTGYLLLEQRKEGVDYLQQALVAFRETDDIAGTELAVHYLAMDLVDSARPVEAIPLLEEGLALARRLEKRQEERTMLSCLGKAYMMIGEYRQSVPYFRGSLALLGESGETSGEVDDLCRLAAVLLWLGEAAEAEQLFELALAQTRASKKSDSEAVVLQWMGNALVFTSGVEQRERGLALLNQALILCVRLQMREREGHVRFAIGRALANSEQQAAEALAYLEQARACAQELGDTDLLEDSLVALSKLHAKLNQPAEALQALQRAQLVSQGRGGATKKATYLSEIGELYEDDGDLDGAFFQYDDALKLARVAGDRAGEAQQLRNIALIMLMQDDEAAGIHFYKQALTTYQAAGNRIEEAATCLLLGLVYEDRDQYARALAYLEMYRFLVSHTNHTLEAHAARALEEMKERADVPTSPRRLQSAQRYLRWLHFQRYWQVGEEQLRRHGRLSLSRNRLHLTLGQQEQLVLLHWDIKRAWQHAQEAAAGERWDEAAAAFREVVQLVRQQRGEEVGFLAHALAHLGDALARAYELGEGVKALEEAQALFLDRADHRQALAVTFHLGVINFRNDCADEALACWEDTRSLAEEQGERHALGSALQVIGIIYRDYYEDLRQAQQYFQQALAVFQSIDEPGEQGDVLVDLGITRIEMGHHQQAVHYHQQAYELIRTSGDQARADDFLCRLAAVQAVAGQFAAATTSLIEAQQLEENRTEGRRSVSIRVMRAITELLQGNTSSYLAHLVEAAPLLPPGQAHEKIRRWITQSAASVEGPTSSNET